MNKKTILITGANGYIGEALSLKLNEDCKNYKIVLLDKKFNKWTKYLDKSIKIIKSDINQISNYISYIKNSDIIIDCIGYTDHNFSNSILVKKDLKTNLYDKINLILELNKINKKIIYFSIGTIHKYGSKHIHKNISIDNSIDHYDYQSVSKASFESYLKLIAKNNNNLIVNILNIGGVFGYNKSNNQSFVNKMILDFINNDKIDFYYKNLNSRYKNIIYIDDLVFEIISRIPKRLISKKNFIEEDIVKYNVNLFDIIKFLTNRFPNRKVLLSNVNTNFVHVYKKKFIEDNHLLKKINITIDKFITSF